MNHARESSRRLSDLLRSEHGAMADFLVALAEFDRERLWVQLGHSSVFYYLHRDLGLSKGAAHYRKVAAQLVQRFPEVVGPLRDGRLCITSVVELARVITPENSSEIVPKFFHRSKQEAKAVAVEIRPAVAIPRREVVTEVPCTAAFHPDETPLAVRSQEPSSPMPPAPPAPPAPPRLEPLTSDLRRLHMTVSKKFLDKLETARKGQGHAQPGASAEQVQEAALDLLLAHQAKRRAEVKRPQQNPRPSKNPGHIPAAVRRAVRARDEGKCQWRLDSGGICGSTMCLEIDHIRPLARGGKSTVENCRLACRFHNKLAARQVYGDDWMDRFVGGTGMKVPIAREAVAPWNLRPRSRDAARPCRGWLDRPPAALAGACERC
jgi:5-methylcytosine-specific restriction endonuclease McrA